MSRKYVEAYEAAKTAARARVGAAQADAYIKLVEQSAGTQWKTGGAAWFKYVTARVSEYQGLPETVFVNRSPETEQWGGCLEGEWVPVPKKEEN